VDLSSVYNIYGIYTDADEAAITTGLDGVGSAYSANLLNSGLDFNGVQFTFGTPNQANAVTGVGISPIALPSGSYGTLQMLATGIEGNQASQTVTVTYTDSTTSQFAQSFSDWCSALNGGGCVSTGNNSGESVAVAMPYRDTASGTDNAVFYLYHYSFALNSGKTAQSLTLPNNRDVVVLAVTLTPRSPGYSLSAGTANPTSVSPGASATATVTVAPAAGYTGTVTLSCSIAPVVSPAPTCSFGNTSPVTVTSASASATLTFTATGPSGAMVRHFSTFYALLLPMPGLALIGLSFGSRRKKLSGFLLLTMLACLIILPACGGGGSSSASGGGGGGNSGTPAGNYTVTITGTDANGAPQSNAAPTVTVTVN
jgi:hypothetical protein